MSWYAAESGLPFFSLFNVSTAEATDHVVGRLLTKLEADGLQEDTVVLAFGMDGGGTSAFGLGHVVVIEEAYAHPGSFELGQDRGQLPARKHAS